MLKVILIFCSETNNLYSGTLCKIILHLELYSCENAIIVEDHIDFSTL